MKNHNNATRRNIKTQEADAQAAPQLSRMQRAVGRIAAIANRMDDKFKPLAERITKRIAKSIEIRDLPGSSEDLKKISNSLVNTYDKNGKMRGAEYKNDLASAKALTVRPVGDGTENAVLGVVLSGDYASAIVVNRKTLENGDIKTNRMTLIGLPYGDYRSDPSKNSAPDRVLASVNVASLAGRYKPGGHVPAVAGVVGSKVKGLEKTDNLSELHYDFAVIADGTYGINDRETKHGTVVLDEAAFSDGTLGQLGDQDYDRALAFVNDLSASPELWDLTMPQVEAIDPSYAMPKFMRRRTSDVQTDEQATQASQSSPRIHHHV